MPKEPDKNNVELIFNVLNPLHTAMTEGAVTNAEFLAALDQLREMIVAEETDNGDDDN